MILTSYGRNQNPTDEFKKQRRTSPDVQLKKFSLTKRKTRPIRTMSEFEKQFLKKSDEKTENQCKNATRENRKPFIGKTI